MNGGANCEATMSHTNKLSRLLDATELVLTRLDKPQQRAYLPCASHEVMNMTACLHTIGIELQLRLSSSDSYLYASGR
jgi:hypothetical protein